MSDEVQSAKEKRKPRWGRRLLAGTILVMLGTIVWASLRQLPVIHRFYTDADTIREPAETARTRDILWQPVRPLTELINTEIDDYEPRLSSDGLTLFFVRGKAGKNADIYVSRRTHQGWTEAAPLDGVNSEHDDLGPEPSADGQSLYFYSDRPGGLGGYDLWVAHRGEDGWQPPLNLGPAANSEFNDYGPALTPDGTTLYFASNRPQPRDSDEPDPNAWQATLREDLYFRDYDLYMSSVTDGGIGKARSLTILNTAFNDGAPAVSSFGDFLYFASDRPGGAGGFDLYRTRRLRGKHEQPDNLGATINTAANELDAGLSLGGYALYFSSDRLLEEGDLHKAREYNLYYSTSREVFAEAEHAERPPINWAALWHQILPNLLWALLALLLLLALWALLRDARSRRLSLLAKCLLASFIAHLLLMLLFNIWEVTSTLAHEFRRRGRIQIALASPSRGNDLSAQLLSGLTEVEAVAPPEIVAERQPSQTEMQPTVEMANLMVSPRPVEVSDESTSEVVTEEATPESPSEPPEFEPGTQSTLEQVALEMGTPLDSTREHTEEAETARLEPLHADVTARQFIETPSTRFTDAIKQLQPPALASDERSWATERASLAEPSAAMDVNLAAADTPSPEQTDADIHRLNVVDVQLPALEAQAAARMSEPVLDVTTAVSSTSRRELPREALIAERKTNPFEVTPRAVPQLHDDGTFMEPPTQTATEASPSHSTAQPTVESQTLFGELSLVELDFSAPESTGTTSVSESTPTEPTPMMGNIRNDMSSEVANLVTPTARVALDPAATDERYAENSLAATSLARTADADIDTTSRAPAAFGAIVATLPEPTDLALPVLEQSDPVRGQEMQATARSQRAGWIRAEAVQDATPSSSLTDIAQFTPVPSVGMIADEDDTLIPPVLPDDHDTARPDAEHTLLASLTPTPRESTAIQLDFRIPTETSPPENPYVQRSSTDRLSLVKRLGGSEETERAVADALRWLAKHQSPDGHWDGDGFDDGCNQCGGETTVVVDHALTGLALLSFLGAGHTHVSDGPYQDTVERALKWLLARQQPDGDLRGEETMYTQGIVTIAVSEAYGMTEDAALADPVRRGARFIDRARNPRVGGWRYDPGQAGDTSVLGWQVMALKSASINGIAVPAGSFRAASEWLDLVSPSSNSGLYAYQPQRGPTPAMTAEGMFSQQLLGMRRDDPRMQASAAYLADYPPDWESQPNTYYWYYATLALFQHQGELWETWNETLTRELLTHQRKDGPAAGSWDPEGEWADIGGRVYQTALCTLMLEVYYRYLPLYSREEAITPIGSIQGTVTDATTGQVLPGATVRLDLPDRSPVTATSRLDGTYTLPTPEVPDYFALSASKQDYIPSSANVAAAMVRGNTLFLDFDLSPVGDQSVAIEPIPDVHHLGDNRFDGTINSQFQKKSEGSEFAADFELQGSQLGPHVNSAEVRLLAKGVQRGHKIRINGIVLDERLDDAPDDGSFGEFSAEFDPDILRAGTNTIEIIAKPSSSDIDDFEFVNVQIHLLP